MTLTWISGANDSSSEGKGDFAYNPGSLNPFSVLLGPIFGPGSNIYVISGPVVDFAADSKGDSWDYSTELRLAYESEGWAGLIGGDFFKSKSSSIGVRQAPSNFAATVEAGFNQHVAAMLAQCPDCGFHFNLGDALEDLTMSADRSRRIGQRENAAIFGMVEYDVMDKLTVSAEARYAWERVTSTTYVEEAIYQYQGNFVGLDHDRDGIPDSDMNSSVRQSTFHSVNPRFTAKFQASDDVNLYLVAARGTKPGGFNNIEVASLGLDTYEEESVWSFEAGAKSTLMDGHLIFNIAIYHNTISGYQLTQAVVIPTLNETTTAVDNTGRVRVKGIELEAVLAVESIPGLVLNANYAYADSNFLEGTDINEGKLLDVLDDNRVNCSTGTVDGEDCQTTADNVLPGSIVGRALPRAPKHMFNMGANYTKAINDDWSVVLNANLSYESKKFVQVHNLAWTGSATLVNASIGVETENIRLVVWGKNLTDENSVVSASRFADETKSFQRNFMGNPRIGRQFGVTGTYKF
ncbi:MAG: TonB-dependent receptor [Emcibacter sp.]|nr:TonB-dependent receptor [Emcibacter sp.]